MFDPYFWDSGKGWLSGNLRDAGSRKMREIKYGSIRDLEKHYPSTLVCLVSRVNRGLGDSRFKDMLKQQMILATLEQYGGL